MKLPYALIITFCVLLCFASCKKEEKPIDNSPVAYGSANHNSEKSSFHDAAVFFIDEGDSTYLLDIYAFSSGIEMTFVYENQDGFLSKGFTAAAFSGSLLTFSIHTTTENLNGITFSEDSIQDNFNSKIEATFDEYNNEHYLVGNDVTITINSFSNSEIDFSTRIRTEDGDEVTANYNGPIKYTKIDL